MRRRELSTEVGPFMYNEQASSSTDPVGVSLVEELRLTRSSQQASLVAESATPEPKDGLVDFCEAAAVRLLSHAVSGEGLVPYQGALGNGELDAASSFGECNSTEEAALQSTLQTLELAALYLWLGRNGEDAQRPGKSKAPAAKVPEAAPAPVRPSRFGFGWHIKYDKETGEIL